MTKNTPYELSLVVLVKNWFRVVSVNNNGVRKVCREVLPGRVPGQTSTQTKKFYIIPNIGKETRREQRRATTTHTMPRKKPTERNAISRAMKAVQTQAMKIVGSPSPKGRVRKIELEFDRLNFTHCANLKHRTGTLCPTRSHSHSFLSMRSCSRVFFARFFTRFR